MKKDLPDATVAALIIADIRKENLLPSDQLVALQRKLGSVGLDANDWMLLADLGASEG